MPLILHPRTPSLQSVLLSKSALISSPSPLSEYPCEVPFFFLSTPVFDKSRPVKEWKKEWKKPFCSMYYIQSSTTPYMLIKIRYDSIKHKKKICIEPECNQNARRARWHHEFLVGALCPFLASFGLVYVQREQLFFLLRHGKVSEQSTEKGKKKKKKVENPCIPADWLLHLLH